MDTGTRVETQTIAPRAPLVAEAAPVVEESGPVRLAPEDLVIAKEEPTRLYELRVLEGSPKQSIRVAAVNAVFGMFAGCPALDEDGKLVGRLSYPRQRLTAKEVETIRAYVRARVVLVRPAGTGNVYLAGDPAIRGQVVRPLAEFLSLTPIPEAEAVEPRPVSMAG